MSDAWLVDVAPVRALCSLFSLALLMLLAWLHHDFQVERYRVRVAALRDSLVDAARRGELLRADAAHRLLCEACAGAGRLGPGINLWSLIYLTRICPPDRQLRQFVSFRAALQAAPPERRRIYRRYLAALHRELLDHAVQNSPLAWMGLMLLGVAGVVMLVVPLGVLALLALAAHQLVWQGRPTLASFAARLIACRFDRLDATLLAAGRARPVTDGAWALAGVR